MLTCDLSTVVLSAAWHAHSRDDLDRAKPQHELLMRPQASAGTLGQAACAFFCSSTWREYARAPTGLCVHGIYLPTARSACASGSDPRAAPQPLRARADEPGGRLYLSSRRCGMSP